MTTKLTTERWQFSLLRILLIVAIVMALFLAPIVWQGIRERHRRAAVQENLQQLRKAVDEYEKQHPKTPGVAPLSPEQSTLREK